MKEAKSIILHPDSYIPFECLSDEQAGMLIKSMLRYAKTGEDTDITDNALKALYSSFCSQFDREWKKYKERCDKNRINALKRHAKNNNSIQSPPNCNDGLQSHTNASNNNSNNNDNSNNKDNNNDDKANAIIIKSDDDTCIDDVWKIYGKPIGDKNEIKSLWEKLTEEEHQAVIAYIPGYVANTPDIKYRKNFNNFLSERYWENHPINIQGNDRNNITNISETERRKRDVYNTAARVIANINRETYTDQGGTNSATEISDF